MDEQGELINGDKTILQGHKFNVPMPSSSDEIKNNQSTAIPGRPADNMIITGSPEQASPDMSEDMALEDDLGEKISDNVSSFFQELDYFLFSLKGNDVIKQTSFKLSLSGKIGAVEATLEGTITSTSEDNASITGSISIKVLFAQGTFPTEKDI